MTGQLLLAGYSRQLQQGQEVQDQKGASVTKTLSTDKLSHPGIVIKQESQDDERPMEVDGNAPSTPGAPRQPDDGKVDENSGSKVNQGLWAPTAPTRQNCGKPAAVSAAPVTEKPAEPAASDAENSIEPAAVDTQNLDSNNPGAPATGQLETKTLMPVAASQSETFKPATDSIKVNDSKTVQQAGQAVEQIGTLDNQEKMSPQDLSVTTKEPGPEPCTDGQDEQEACHTNQVAKNEHKLKENV